MRLTHISEEQFAAMVKGMGTRAKSPDGVKEHTTNGGGGGGAGTERRTRGTLVKSSARTTQATMQSFFVPGPLPGANDIIRKHWRVYDKLKKHWGDIVQREIICAALKPMRACSITYHWVERTPRRGRIRDRDNIRFGAKFINDALVSQRILEDDGPDGVVSLTDTFAYNAVNPGVFVTLREMEGGK